MSPPTSAIAIYIGHQRDGRELERMRESSIQKVRLLMMTQRGQIRGGGRVGLGEKIGMKSLGYRFGDEGWG